MSRYPDNFNAHAFDQAFGGNADTNASDAIASLLEAVMGMTPETLVGSYAYIEKQVTNILIEHDGDVTQIDAMNVDNWGENDPEDIWMRLAGIHDALDLDCEKSGYFDDVSKAYDIHMDGFRVVKSEAA